MAGKYEVSNDEPIFRLPPFKVEEVVLIASETVDWGLEMFSIPSFWRDTKGEGVKVAVLDTGIALQHSDVKKAVCDSKDFTGSSAGAYDLQGHGTHVAGIIAAREDNNGVVGVAPLAELYIGKVLGDNGSGTAQSVADGIQWAVEQGVDIISMSLGSPYLSEIIHNAIIEAEKKGVFIICAAGNEGPRLDTVGYPARFKETVSVGSIDRSRKISHFSARGDQVDIVAPGDKILSTYPPQSYATLSGTSMATPFVTGVVALMVAKHKKFGGDTPVKSQTDLIQHLRKTAIDAGPVGFDPNYGFGIINPEDLLHFQSARLLQLLASEDLTESGRKKLNDFIGGEIRPTPGGESYLEGSIRDGVGEIRGGIRIKL